MKQDELDKTNTENYLQILPDAGHFRLYELCSQMSATASV